MIDDIETGGGAGSLSAWPCRRCCLVAFVTLVLVSLSTAALAGVNTWTSSGPEGGNILSLAIAPSTIPGSIRTVYAGTFGGGVFKSTDGAATWIPVNTGLADLVIYSLAIDPTDSNTLYAGSTGASGGDVFKSTDGGLNWSRLASFGVHPINVVAVAPTTPSTVYAGTTAYSGGLYESTDGGATWSRTNLNLSVYSLLIDPQNPHTIYVGSGGLYKSTDDGATWTNLPSGGGRAIAIDPSNPQTLYAADGGGVYKTTDGAANWDSVTSVSNSSIAALAVDPSSTNTLYAATDNAGIFKSTDGGTTWTAISGVPTLHVQTLAIAPEGPTVLYAGTADAGLFRSADGALTWTARNHGLTNTSAAAVAVDPFNRDTVYAGTDHALFRSTDGGAHWAALDVSGGDLSVSTIAISPVTQGSIFVGTNRGVFASTDGGMNWTQATNAPGNIGVLTITPSDPISIYAATESGVFKSTDSGASWTYASSGLGSYVRAMAVDPIVPSTLYAGDWDFNESGNVFKSTDGAATWTATSLQTGPVVALATAPTSPVSIYAGLFFGRGISKSNNGGDAWVSVGLPSTSITAIATSALSPATVYAGSNGSYGGSTTGVWRSLNGGASWTYASSGLNTAVSFLAVDPTTANTVYCATSGSGVFRIDFSSQATPSATATTPAPPTGITVTATPTTQTGPSATRTNTLKPGSPTVTPTRTPFAPIVEFINPRSRGAVLTDSSGNIVLDFGKLGAAAALSSLPGNPTPGATADGVTRLLIRAWSNVSVTFQLPGGSADGCLATIAEPQSCGDSVTTQSHPVPSLGRSAAFALYITPTDFTAGATNQVTRQISLNVSNSGGSTPSSFALWRPPILLVHGLWGSSDMWDAMENRLNASFDAPLTIQRADYSGTNASALSANQSVLFGEIQQVVGALADQGIAAVQVDVVAKSMGGLLSRLWTQDRAYRLARNYLQGDIHKLITLDTPHCGSFLASWVLPELSLEQPRYDSDDCGFLNLKCPIIAAFYTGGMPIMYGAIPDLARNSPAIQSISLTNVPSHPIAGNAIPAGDLVDVPCFGNPYCEGIEAAVVLLKAFGVNTVVVDTSDLVVEVPSQLDHLSSEMATSQFPVIHIGPPYPDLPLVVENNGPVEDHVAALLQAPITGSQLFTDLPAGAECSSAAESVAAITKTSGSQQVDGGVTIISPASGVHFEPGQTVHIEFQFGNGFSPATVLVLSRIGTQNPGTALTADLQIPAAFAGELPIGVLAIDASGRIADDFVSVVVAPSAAPTALVITPNPVVLNAVPLKVSQQLSVSGTLPGGTSVDLTTGVTGTTYSSGAPGVIGVGPNGLVTASSSGTATITVTYGTVSQPVQVTASNHLDDEAAALAGDLNRDGQIDGADLNEVIHRLFVGLDADVNADLTTSAPDVTAIERLIGQQRSASP